MQKKIYITALILFLIALSLIIFLTNNQKAINSDGEVSGKLQEQVSETKRANENQYNSEKMNDQAESLVNIDGSNVSKLPLESF